MIQNPLSNEFEALLDEEDFIVSEAYEIISDIMVGREVDFSTALVVALRDWICEAHEDHTMGAIILKEVAKGLES